MHAYTSITTYYVCALLVKCTSSVAYGCTPYAVEYDAGVVLHDDVFASHSAILNVAKHIACSASPLI
jgi:hypothetical protein